MKTIRKKKNRPLKHLKQSVAPGRIKRRRKSAGKAGPASVKAKIKVRKPGISRQGQQAFNQGYDMGFSQGFAQGMQDGESYL
ncbi:MAG: hypothetical protein K0R57_6440 [Paenibacillaceae bacterium]|jgi:flagellar biosynthesis/type III secretory pathway protein FliH|nr:hypothetical protein [Paenibacillaceae bacterium]